MRGGSGLSRPTAPAYNDGVGVTQSAETFAEVSQEALDEIVRRIVAVAQPEKIILFGSAARGRIGPHSDVDLLVIKGGQVHRGHLTEEIYMNLRGVRYPVDVIVVSPEDVEIYRHSFCLVIAPALAEGRVIYDAIALQG